MWTRAPETCTLLHIHASPRGTYTATWQRKSHLPWHEADSPNHLDDKEQVVKKNSRAGGSANLDSRHHALEAAEVDVGTLVERIEDLRGALAFQA